MVNSFKIGLREREDNIARNQLSDSLKTYEYPISYPYASNEQRKSNLYDSY